MGVAVPDPEQFNAAARKLRRNQLLIFSRWCQVMFRFEKELYGNPDQDLNRLWWDLVGEVPGDQAAGGPQRPDYAGKIHIVTAPVYYHNYMMGELFASQLHHAIAREVFRGRRPGRRGLRGQSGRRAIHVRAGVRPGPHAELEPAHAALPRART